METEIVIETTEGVQKHRIEACNNFEKILTYFYKLISSGETSFEECAQNIEQARLVSEVLKNSQA